MTIFVNTISENSTEKDLRYFKVFLAILSGLGMVLVIYATTPYGAGVSGDAANNLSVAENLLKGKGFVDLFGGPLIYWPPLYPVLLAGFGVLFHGDVFLGGWYFNIILTGINIYYSGKLLSSIFRAQPLFKYIGSLIIFLSLSSFRVNVNIASDPLYITFSLFFLIAAGRYLEMNSRAPFWSMALYAALAVLQRFVGILLIATGCCLIVWQNWKHWKALILENLKFGISSSLPVIVWIIGHNLQYGVVGGNPSNIIQPLENTRMSLLKMMLWFIPVQLIPNFIIKYPWVVYLACIILLVLINRRPNWSTWWKALLTPFVVPEIIFLLFSIITLIFSISTPDHRSLASDRYYVGLLVPTLALLFITYEYLILPHLNLHKYLPNRVLFSLFILWGIYQISGFYEFIQMSRASGEVMSYNSTNTKAIRDSKTLNYINSLIKANRQVVLYTNDPPGVWFVTRQNAQLLPWLPEGQSFDKAMINKLNGWPPEKEAYVIWVRPDSYQTTVTPRELLKVASLNLIFSAPDGDIYLARSKSQ